VKFPRLGGEVRGAAPETNVAETAGGLRVDGDAGADADEVADQVGVAADEAELAAELLFSIGGIPGTPSPPPGAGGCGINRAES
jgi:hypothetical protein